MAPLADRMRPRSLDEVVGQEHLLGPGRVLRAAIESGQLHSMILWGPPGSGKTTLASLMASVVGAHFVAFSAVLSGVKEIREVVAAADAERRRRGVRTILFVDEIHRFNRAQQDAFLPHVEKGTVVLVGATTENPSFEVNAALLSRCRVYVLRGLADEQLVAILKRALADRERGLGRLEVEVTEEAHALIARLANADARAALTILELAAGLTAEGEGRRRVTDTSILEAAQRKTLLYDKAGEEHYNLISALHKSLRDSDPDGALYWMTRMLESGEDPLYVARRLVRFASEDVGNADPAALESDPRGQGRLRLPGIAGGRAGPRPGHPLSGPGPEIERRLRGVQRGQAGRARAALGARAPPPPQRADPAHEGPRLRRRATSTRTTPPTPWWIRSTCRSRCASAATTARSIAASRRSWPAASRPGAPRSA